MTDVNTKKLALLKKVLAIANNEGATEGEREAAMRQASKIMQKYNLSLSELPADQQDEAREEQDVTISADTWARSLAQSVGSLFFCNYYYCRTSSAGKDKHVFFGRQSNVVTAMHMAEHLIKSIKREATKRYKSPTSPEGRSFCVGTVATIRRRVIEMKQTPADDAAPGTAVALINLYAAEDVANEAWLKAQGTDLKMAKSRKDTRLVAGAFYDGKASFSSAATRSAGGSLNRLAAHFSSSAWMTSRHCARRRMKTTSTHGDHPTAPRPASGHRIDHILTHFEPFRVHVVVFETLDRKSVV